MRGALTGPAALGSFGRYLSNPTRSLKHPKPYSNRPLCCRRTQLANMDIDMDIDFDAGAPAAPPAQVRSFAQPRLILVSDCLRPAGYRNSYRRCAPSRCILRESRCSPRRAVARLLEPPGCGWLRPPGCRLLPHPSRLPTARQKPTLGQRFVGQSSVLQRRRSCSGITRAHRS